MRPGLVAYSKPPGRFGLSCRRDTRRTPSYIATDVQRERGVRTADRMGRPRVRGGLGRGLCRTDATRLQLLPLPRGPRGRRGGSDVADVREGVARAESLSP